MNDSGQSGATSAVLQQSGTAVFATDPNGGYAIAGPMAANDAGPSPWPNQIALANPSGVLRYGPRPLGSSGPVFGLGLDQSSRALVIQGGATAACGSGCITGQWFGQDGAALTEPFTLLTGFVAGPSTWFQTAPLIGGGLAVRRMDASTAGSSQRGFHSTWLVTVDSGKAQLHAAPDWMTARPDTDLMPARGNRGYAVLPEATTGGACSQRLEVLSPAGNSCAAYDLAIAPRPGCDAWELKLGFDGTVLQRLPPELETDQGGNGRIPANHPADRLSI